MEPKELTPLELAAIAYHAYGKTTDFKNFRGEPMPEFHNLPENITQAWTAAVSAVKDELLPPTPLTDLYEQLERGVEGHKTSFPKVGREIAVAVTNLQTSKLWFEKALGLISVGGDTLVKDERYTGEMAKP